MYKEPHRWTMPYVFYALLTTVQNHTRLTEKRTKVMERSIFTAENCFVKNMHHKKTIDESMYKILKEWFRFNEKTISIQADLIIYLRTSPEIVHERMLKRGRSAESTVSLQYLQELHELHEDWLIRRPSKTIPILVLNGDLDLANIGAEYKRAEYHILNATLKAEE